MKKGKMSGRVKRATAVLLTCTLMAVSAAGCGSKESAEGDEQLVFRMAIVDGESSPIYTGAKAMADKVKKDEWTDKDCCRYRRCTGR